MDFNSTIDLIIKDLDEAREIIDDLKKYPGVPVLQVELAKSKCKSAGEVIALLKSLRVNTPAEREETKILTVPVISTTLPDTKKEEQIIIQDKVSESAIFADKFSHLANRFNEQIGSRKGDSDVAETLKAKPLTSLSEAIGVNDKFLFIREIFDGNKEAYTQAISRLDHAENINDARAVIMSYTGYSNENKAIIQLLDLVKRKLPSNE